MRSSRYLYVAFLLTFLLSVQFTGAKILRSENIENSVNISIDQAYYADLEDDGLENDIFVLVSLEFYGSNSYNFDYLIYLTLPSGSQYIYSISLSSRLQVLQLSNFFWNHAIESGWYHVEVDVVMRTGGITISSADLIFDPPGGSGGSDPISFSLSIT